MSTMWQHTYRQKTNLEPRQIWPVLADISRWPKIDPNIEYVEINDTPNSGVGFVLKPKGGPKLRFRIGLFDPPRVYSDICTMPLAEMHTVHEIANGELVASIRIEGLLSSLWGLVVGRKHAHGLPLLTERLLNAAASNNP